MSKSPDIVNGNNIPANVFLLTGTNIGDRLQNLKHAQIKISERLGDIIFYSHIYETEPWGYKTNTSFYNQALQIKSFLSPLDLMSKIRGIENETGKIRDQYQYNDRILDIDILFFENRIININGLIIPHPLLHFRKFALIPLKEIAPDLLHPVLNKSITKLLTDCKDKNSVKKLILPSNTFIIKTE